MSSPISALPRLRVGAKASRSVALTAEHVRRFAEISGDHNPLHFDPAFAAATKFGRLVVQGGLTTGLLHALVAQDLPGPGTVFLSQNWRFTAPVFVGDTITALAEITSVHPTKPVCELVVRVERQDGTTVLEGEAGCYRFLPEGFVRSSAGVEFLGTGEFRGEIVEGEDVSAAAMLGDGRLVIAGDEGASIQILRQIVGGEENEHWCWEVESTLELADAAKGEADLESIAVDGRTIWITGSHSVKRPTVDGTRTRKKNRKRLRKVVEEPRREVFFRVEIADDAAASKIKRYSLHDLLRRDKVLRTFVGVPSKENGIDIEGLAHDGEALWFGLRGPVLRGNYVPIVRVPQKAVKNPEDDYEIVYVDLGGCGVRDMACVDDGFLILAGPVGDSSEAYHLYFWDGSDSVPGRGEPTAAAIFLGVFPLLPGSKNEGMTVLAEHADHWDLLIVFDGLRGGDPRRFRAAKPHR